jgi:hypothetical protein
MSFFFRGDVKRSTIICKESSVLNLGRTLIAWLLPEKEFADCYGAGRWLTAHEVGATHVPELRLRMPKFNVRRCVAALGEHGRPSVHPVQPTDSDSS